MDLTIRETQAGDIEDMFSARGFVQPCWLAASADPTIRAHGFYRALGWQPTGQVLENGDEVLQLQPNNVPQPTSEDA